MADDSTPTKVQCPVCTPCPVCHDLRVVSARDRAHYRAVMGAKKDPCPRCEHYGKSTACVVCSGTFVVSPGVTIVWQALHGNTRQSNPGPDYRKDE